LPAHYLGCMRGLGRTPVQSQVMGDRMLSTDG
jgi:hypothetical protein